jgi:hypothetical protein
MLVSNSASGRTLSRIVRKQVLTLALVCAGALVAACEPSAEEQALDPANCEQMKDIPEAYQRCLEELR